MSALFIRLLAVDSLFLFVSSGIGRIFDQVRY
jgi:hypothetical protein